ncbi:MAG: methylmalonyl Co-A mutase-associated GTPase MeaB [Candidatus Sulfopaludibacter sp.]|nr:methylmalonyl Co-A mutase-associated GTPase MeaB [Candidatus Sulfopaludibacter sp.]
MTDWARKIRDGDARLLARAATAVENRDPRGAELLRDLAPFAGHARIVGITGPPGAGKSTLVDGLALALRQQGKTVAILAVDPSSRATGGAILGDRIRMQQHHADAGIFIRSMATRGSLGGLARATRDLARLMDGAGRDYVLIETVGVGQDEVAIAGLAQVTVVVLVPGMGDDVQAIKAGIMEIADVFAINKADQAGADRVERELQAMLSLSGGIAPAIVRTIATAGAGIAELLAAIDRAFEKPAVRRTVAPSLDHLGIAVRALDPAIAFYQALGLTVEHRESIAAEKVNVAMLPAGDSRIELLEPSTPDSPIAKFLEKRGPGLHHVALRVPDLNAAVERLAAAGARLLNAPREGAAGHTYVFVHPASAGGVLLELIQSEDWH